MVVWLGGGKKSYNGTKKHSILHHKSLIWKSWEGQREVENKAIVCFALWDLIKLKINMYRQNATSNRRESEHFSSFKHL